MPFPAPSQKQAKVLWFSLTALALAVFLALLGLMFWGIGWLIDRLSPVLLPLAVAAIVAYLLNPLVNYFESKYSDTSVLFKQFPNAARLKAILSVLMLAVMLVTLVFVPLGATVVDEVKIFARELPAKSRDLGRTLNSLYLKMESFRQGLSLNGTKDSEAESPDAQERDNPSTLAPRGSEAVDREGIEKFISDHGQNIGGWVMTQARSLPVKVVGWFGLLVGLALVPLYVFYFLLEARGIEDKWTNYLPLMESKFKEEAVFVLKSFNDCLIVFFRCQILVAVCVGTLLAIGFWIINMPHGILLGLIAGLIGIIPYFGVIITTVPVVGLSMMYAQQIHWVGDSSNPALWAPMLALSVCALVLLLEKTVIQPKIVGDRVGMHPVAVIIAVLMGTALVGGILGGLLAIPIVMAARTFLFRYVWAKRASDGSIITEEDAVPEDSHGEAEAPA